MPVMERFDDVSVLASVDESPPPPRVPRGARRAFTAVIASVVVAGALAGAAVGLASEKQEPARSAPAAEKGWEFMGGARHHECHRGEGKQRPSSASGLRY
jgi:hypothetical protein